MGGSGGSAVPRNADQCTQKVSREAVAVSVPSGAAGLWTMHVLNGCNGRGQGWRWTRGGQVCKEGQRSTLSFWYCLVLCVVSMLLWYYYLVSCHQRVTGTVIFSHVSECECNDLGTVWSYRC